MQRTIIWADAYTRLRPVPPFQAEERPERYCPDCELRPAPCFGCRRREK